MTERFDSDRRFSETVAELNRLLAQGSINEDFREEVLAQVHAFNDYAASRGLEPGTTYLVMGERVFQAATLADALDRAFDAGVDRRPYYSEEIETLPPSEGDGAAGASPAPYQPLNPLGSPGDFNGWIVGPNQGPTVEA